MAERGLAVEVARPADVPAVIALIRRVFEEYHFVFDPATEVPDLLAFGSHYRGSRGEFFVIRDGRRVVGSAGVERLDRATAELHRLYLDPPLRGRGLGRALVEHVLAWCHTEGLEQLTLWSDTRFDRAHALYEAMGFRRGGERTLPGDVNQTREYQYARPVRGG